MVGPNDSSTYVPDTSALSQLSDEEFWNYAYELASAPPQGVIKGVINHAPTNGLERTEYLLCKFRSGDYLIPLTALHEVVLAPHDILHAWALLPGMPAWMVGVTAWRDETIAVIDLDAYLGHSQDSLDPTLLSLPLLYPASSPTLLIASCDTLNGRAKAGILSGGQVTYGLPIGLLVPAIVPKEDALYQIPSDAIDRSPTIPILDIGPILEDVIQQIKDACPS